MAEGGGYSSKGQRRIKANHDFLVEKLPRLHDLTEHLVSALVFSPQDVSFVHKGDNPRAARTKTKCNERFVNRLLEKGPHAYQAFIDALKEVGSLSIIRQLEPTDTNPPDFSATGKKTDRRENVLLFPSGSAGTALGEVFPTQALSVQNMYINRVDHLAVSNSTQVGQQCTGQQGNVLGTEEMCQMSLLLALLKNILLHCPKKEEALYTLEQKLFTGLRDEGKDIVCFQEKFGIPFRKFLENNSDHFDVTERGNEFIVSRINDRRVSAPATEVSRRDVVQPSNEVRRPSREEVRQDRPEMEKQAAVLPMGITAGKTKSSPLSGTGDRFQHDTTAIVRSGDLTKGTTPNKGPVKEKGKFSSAAPRETHLHASAPSSFVARCLAKQPGDDIIFRTSSDVYKKDPIQFSIDVVSLWNTPDRDEAFIVLGIKCRVSLPHQVIGLRSGSTSALYKKLFMGDLFDFKPEFAYQEIMYERKLIGVLKVEKSEGSVSPSIVNSDKHVPRLRKNKLWVRKDGKNVALGGSDMADTLVKRVYSWFLRSKQIGAKLPKTAADQDDAGSSGSSNDSLSADTEEPGPHRAGSLPPKETAENDGHLHAPLVHSPPVISEEIITHADRSISPLPATRNANQHEVLNSSDLLQALAHFKNGHFVLLCGTLKHVVSNLHVLSSAPWIAVYDFDVSSRESGMLACLEDGLSKTRSISVCTWMDTQTGITERGTQWWSLRGRLDVPDSILSDLSPVKWLQKVCDKVDKMCLELARFSQDYTVLRILALWPETKEEMRCMLKFLCKLLERVNVTPSLLLWFNGNKTEHADSFEVQIIREEWEDNVKLFHLSLEAFCTEAENLMGNTTDQMYLYQLPSEDSTTIDVSLERASYMMQDCEVLYLNNPYSMDDLTADALDRERDNFFRGGSISWTARYDMGGRCFDVERTVSKEIVDHIEKVYIKGFRSGIIQLLHAPGSGGSTMAQRILFHFHKTTPCVHVKQRSGSSTGEIAERLIFLYNSTRMPVLALLDGEDDQTLQQMRTQLRHIVVIFLSVKRYPHQIDKSHCSVRLSRFFLPGIVNEQESRHLVMQFRSCCQGVEGKVRALKLLDDDVQKKRVMHQMFEYGLTVYDHEYRGVRAYVKGYLQIDHTKPTGLKQWQKCLGYVSLVYYYAHASLPSHFVGKLLGQSTNAALTLADFQHEVRMLVVADTNEGRGQYVRIMHYAVATEILEQILNDSEQRSEDGRLSTKAKENLKYFCIDFLDQTAELTTKSSEAVMNILTKTFIIRGIDILDCDTGSDSETKKKPPQFSQILLDLDSQAPYHDRLEVLQKLCDVYPDNPNFKAHLGRFYSLCQPQKEQEAEKMFKAAIQTAHEIESDSGKFPNTRDRPASSVDLMFIHHMYACFFQRKVQRRKQAYSTPRADAGVDHDIQPDLNEIIADAEQACQNFSRSRSFCPLGGQEDHCYLSEIDVRLQTCTFIARNVPRNSEPLLQSLQYFNTAYTFFRTSVLEIEDLIMECYNTAVLNDDGLAELQKRIQKFNVLFRGYAEELQAVADLDPLTSLRLKITAKKLQYDRTDNVVFAENPQMPSDVIAFVVETYEAIFSTKAVRRDIVPAKLEMDYRNWIFAIRNPNFQQDYAVERVLAEVRRWCDAVSSPQTLSYFYLFTVLSLLGFGTQRTPGHEECLVEAQKLKVKTMRALSKTDPRASQQREWLGREESSGIRRLLSNSYVPKEDHRLTGTAMGRLAVCKGTVLGKPRPSAGLISMDVNIKASKPPSVKIFFVPARVQDSATLYKGSRVQFHLGFNQENGYKAFEVQVLKKFRCKSCGLWAEMTKDQTSITCKGRLDSGKQCGAKVCKDSKSDKDL